MFKCHLTKSTGVWLNYVWFIIFFMDFISFFCSKNISKLKNQTDNLATNNNNENSNKKIQLFLKKTKRHQQIEEAKTTKKNTLFILKQKVS